MLSKPFETFLENDRFCRKSENDAYSRVCVCVCRMVGVGEGWVMLFASLWCITHENRYVSPLSLTVMIRLVLEC